MRLLIALSMRSRKLHFYLERTSVAAVRATSSVPVLALLLSDRDVLFALMKRCAGLLLSGSRSDVDPRRSERPSHSRLGPVPWERNETDGVLLEAAEARRLPALAIGSRMQRFHAFRRSTLDQDIASEPVNVLRHEQDAPGDWPAHRMRVKDVTILARLAGGTVAEVNNVPPQAVKAVGRDLRPIASSEDGITETLLQEDPFILGAKRHPGATFASDAFSQAIFAQFPQKAEKGCDCPWRQV